jgi:dipeptidyl aminopeptidase/acylaminoacyl peptidase
LPHLTFGQWILAILAATGIGVYYSNPRGSEGYGREFNEANLRDWGHGPMRDLQDRRRSCRLNPEPKYLYQSCPFLP